MRRTPRYLAIAALTLALTSCTPALTSPEGAGVPTPSATPTPSPTPTAVIDVPVASGALKPVKAVDPPVRVRVAAAGIDMSIQPTGIEETGGMELPKQPTIAGWYKYGSAPTTGEGNTVLAAHVDSSIYGLGPFVALRDLAAGTEIAVESASGAVTRYTLESVTYYPRFELPGPELFTRSGPERLVLITCGGNFDAERRSYSDNVVAVAVPLP